MSDYQRSALRLLPLLAACLTAIPALAGQPRQSDFGGVGLMQTPTARMAPEGQLSFNANRTSPYSRYSISAQPLPWLEGTIRYMAITNRNYGPESLSGDQSYKDKAVDAKIRLLQEGYWRPEVAFGMRDIGGTGLFSSEYFVASKRWDSLDFSLGMAWGYIGNRGDIRNPLGYLKESFDERDRNTTITDTGDLASDAFFRGRPGFFGGLSWDSPVRGLQLQLEVEGNDYQSEPQGNNQKQDHPINLGAVYQLSPSVLLRAGWQRGNTAMFGITFTGNLKSPGPAKLLDPAPEARKPLPTGVGPAPIDWQDVSQRLRQNAGFEVQTIEQRDRELIITGEQKQFRDQAKGLGRAARVLDNSVDQADYDWYTLVDRAHGMEQSEASINPQRLREYEQNALDRDGLRRAVVHAPPALRATEVLHEQPQDPFNWGLSLGYNQNVGGPDGFILYQFLARAKAQYHFDHNRWVQGSLAANLLNNFDKFRYDAPSNLPRVRTNIREYMTTSDVVLENLQYTQTMKFDRDFYAMGYAGLLETMYGGVGAELLYRPFGADWAVGIDANWVRQRGFRQDFSFRDYSTWTGHVTGYYQTGFHNLLTKLSVGRYLAGDYGFTLDISRRFDNGVVIGAWGTLTNVSSEEFGEGSFDKGVYFTFPFDAFFARSTQSQGTIAWNPLTRDGGARLARYNQLYEMTHSTSSDRFNDGFRHLGE